MSGGCTSVSVRQIEYRGWDNAVELSNGQVRVVVVPQIGRIMHYAFVGQDNILFETPSLFGVTLDDSKLLRQDGQPIWASFGGDRVWPSEEDQFVVINGHRRPPDPWLDGFPWQATLLPEGVQITSGVSDHCGAQVTRTIRLKPDSAQVVIAQRMDKIKPAAKSELEPVPLTIWNVTQIRPPSVTLLPLNPDSVFVDRCLIPHWDDYDNQGGENVTVCGDIGLFVPDAVRNQKIGADATGWVAGIIGSTMMIESFEYDASAVYPDGGTSATIFTCPEFAELECLSPLKRLKVGDCIEHTIVWDLVKLQSD
ncbi:MAG: hypothetical protein ACYTEM_06890 [Planctomycetota bacterium]|jgi:hypothetical protein